MRLILAVIFTGAALTGCEPALFGHCADTVKHEAISPGGRYVAAVFERDCGATTDYSTNLSLRDAKEPFNPSEQHPVLTVEGQPAIALEWSSDESLTVVLPTTETFTKEEAWQDVRIVYK
jgi:hypothetical protein